MSRPGTLQRALQRPSGLAGMIILLPFVLLAGAVWFGWLGQEWANADGGRFESPSAEHWFGTNALGQDIFSRAVFSVQKAFEIGLLVSFGSVALGSMLGALAGWFEPRWPDSLISWMLGVLDAIPFYLFVAAVAFALRGQDWAMHAAMVGTFWTSTARLVRAETLRLRSREYVLSAKVIGLPTWRILARHILPNASHILLVQLSLTFVAAVKTEVVLSFLGIGVQDGVSWGLMLAESTQEILNGQFANFLAASTMLFLTVLGFHLLTDSVQEAMDPRQSVV